MSLATRMGALGGPSVIRSSYRVCSPIQKFALCCANSIAGKKRFPAQCLVENVPKATRSEEGNRVKVVEPNSVCLTTLAIFLLNESPAMAEAFAPSNPFQGDQAKSLYVTLALFLMSVPGIWSQIKRAPAASKKRKTYEVDGPARPGAMPLKNRATQIVAYFKKYNYEIKEMGDVITFVGMYNASKGQAAAVTFYTFVGLGSVALVLSVLVPQLGNWWYALTLLSPGAWFYYFSRGTRAEEMRVKMATADDEQTTDIIVEGDPEELERFCKELGLAEKGMVYVKGLLEQ